MYFGSVMQCPSWLLNGVNFSKLSVSFNRVVGSYCRTAASLFLLAVERIKMKGTDVDF